MRKAQYLSLLGATLMIAGPMALGTSAAAGYGASAADERGNSDVKATWLCGNGVDKASISLDGTVTLRGVGVAVRFEATGKGTGNADVKVNTDGIDITFAKGVEIPKKNVGGNPYIYFQPTNKNGDKLDMAPILLGRCKGNIAGSGRGQGQAHVDMSTLAMLGANSCGNKGSSIGLNRQHNRAMHGRVILSNQATPDGVRSQTSDQIDQIDVDFGVASASKVSNVDTGVGGNPTIKTLFFKVNRGAVKTDLAPSSFDGGNTWVDADGNATEVYSIDAATNKPGYRNLGRCSEIGK